VATDLRGERGVSGFNDSPLQPEESGLRWRFIEPCNTTGPQFTSRLTCQSKFLGLDRKEALAVLRLIMDAQSSQLDYLLAALRLDIAADKAQLQRTIAPESKPKVPPAKPQATPQM